MAEAPWPEGSGAQGMVVANPPGQLSVQGDLQAAKAPRVDEEVAESTALATDRDRRVVRSISLT